MLTHLNVTICNEYRTCLLAPLSNFQVLYHKILVQHPMSVTFLKVLSDAIILINVSWFWLLNSTDRCFRMECEAFIKSLRVEFHHRFRDIKTNDSARRFIDFSPRTCVFRMYSVFRIWVHKSKKHFCFLHRPFNAKVSYVNESKP